MGIGEGQLSDVQLVEESHSLVYQKSNDNTVGGAKSSYLESLLEKINIIGNSFERRLIIVHQPLHA